MMSQPTLNALDNTQGYLNQFHSLDKDHLGYLNVAQVKDYFKSQQLPQDDLIELASHSNQGRLTPEQFASIMNLSEMKKQDDVGYHSSKFSSLLRHCEEAMKQVEKDRRMKKVPSSDSKDTLLKAFKALEDFMKQFIQSLDEKPQDKDRSLNRSIAPSTFEKMPGTFDFDNASSDNLTSPEPSMQTASAAAPVFLKGSPFDGIPESTHARQQEKEPVLDLPLPLPQMNDAADAFMSDGWKPISNRNLNGDGAKPNNAHENDTLRSNVLDSLRNAAMNNDEADEDASKEREILSDEESHERAIPSTSSDRGMTSNSNVNAITPGAFNTQSSDMNSKLEPESATSGPLDSHSEEALVPLAASVATVAAATAAAATALSDNSKSASHPANPLDSATTTKSYAPETFQGGLGGDGSEPFIKNAEDTELKPEDQPSFGAEQAKLNTLNGTEGDSVDSMEPVTSGTYSSLPKFGESKPFEREVFQGGLGGNGTEPYIKNEKDTLLKPEDQPSFGAAEQERMDKLNGADEDQVESDSMEQPHYNSKPFSNKHGSSFVPESFQGGLGGAGTEPYIKNEKDTLLKPEDQPSFGAEQEKLRRLSQADDEDESTDDLTQADKDIESSHSLGSTLSKIGAGAAGIAGAAALGLSERHDANDKSNDRNISSGSLDNASGHDVASPRSVYSPSLTSGSNLEDTTSSDVISNEALDTIADKVDADIKHEGLYDNSLTTDKDGVISSDALDKIADNLDAALEDNALPGSASVGVSPHDDVHVMVEQDTSLPPHIGNEVDIETANNDSNRSPLADTAGFHDLPLDDATNALSTSASSSVSPKGDDENKEEGKPGFFKKLFGGRSKSPEPASRSIPVTSDKATSKDSSPSPKDSKGSTSNPDVSISDKIHAFNVHVPQTAVNVDSLTDMSPNARGADGSFTSPSVDAHVPSTDFNSNVGVSNVDLADTDGKLDTTLDTPKIDSDIKSPGFNANTNADASGLSPSFEKLSADIKGLPESVSGKLGGSVGSPDVDTKLPSLDADLNGSGVDMPDVGSKMNSSIKSPGVGAALPSFDADIKTPNFEKSSVDSKLDGSVDISDIEGKLPSLSAGFEGPNANLPSTDLPNLGGKLDKSISTPEIDSDMKSPGFNANVDLDASGLSGSLGKLSAGLKDFKSDFSGKLDGSYNSPNKDRDLPSLDADMKGPSVNLPNADGQLNTSMKTPDIEGKVSSFSSDIQTPSVDMPNVGGSLKTSDVDVQTPSIDNKLKSPSFNADVNMDRPDLSGSLGELSSSFKGLKDSFSGKLSGDAPSIDGELPSANADLKGSNVELPDFDGKLPSVDADLKTPKLDTPSFDGSINAPDVDGKLPSVNADLSGPNVDVPNVGGKLDRSISVPKVDSDVQSPKFDANVNMDGSSLSGSLGKLSAGLKGLKDDISGAFGSSVDTPNMDGELPNVDASMHTGADLPHIDGKMPSLNADLDAPQFDKPSIDGNLTDSLDTPTLDGNFPALDADIKKPDVDLPNVSGKLDRSISAPDVNGEMRSPGYDAGSLGKLSAGLKDLKDDISGKLNGSLESPNVDGKAPAFGVNIKSPSAELPDVSGALDSSMETPDMDAKLPSLDSDIKAPSIDMPNVDGKLDGSIKTPDFNGELPSADGKLKSPAFNANVNVDRPDLSGSLGKLSSSFKGLKDGISGKLSGEAPHVGGEAPSLNADLEKPELPNVHTNLDTDLITPKLEAPTLGGNLDASLSAPDMDGKLPSLDTNANLPYMSGKLDRSISAPDVKADLKTSEFNSDVNIDATGVSASLGKLSAGLKDFKSNISSKFDGSMDSPDIDGKLPAIDAKLKGLDAEIPDVDGKLDGSIKTPGMEGNLPSLNSGFKKSLDADLPNVDADLNGSFTTPDVNAKLPSIDGDLKAPTANLDADVDTSRPSLSGSLGKLSSSFKDFKKEISGKFSGSVDAPNVDGKLPTLDTDFKSRDVELPDIHKELPSLNADIEGPNVGSPDINKKLPSLNADLQTPKLDNSSLDGKLGDSLDAPDLGGKLPSLNADFKGPNVDLPSASVSKLDGSINTADIDAKLPSVDADVDASRPSLSGSLGKLSSSFKDLKKEISGQFSGSLDAPDVDGKLPAVDADMKSRSVELPDIHKELPSLSVDMKTPKLESPSLDGKLDGALSTPHLDGKLPSLNADIDGPEADLPNLSGKFDDSLDTPDINAKLHSIEGDFKTPDVHVDANVDASRPSLSGLGKLSSSFKGLKDSISGKFSGDADTPHVDGELPSVSADLPDPNGKLPAVDVNLSGVKFGMPSVDGKLTNYMDPPTADAKLPALDAADLKKPDIDLPHVSGKLDRSVDAPEIDSDAKLSGFNANVDMDASGLSGSLGKLSAGLKDLQHDISSKFDGSMKSPHAEGKLPSLDANINGPSTDLPDVSGKINASISTPSIDDQLPSLSSDINTPNVDMPNVDAKLDNTMSVPDIDAKLPSIESNMKTPDVNLDADVDASSRPSLSGTLGKLSSSFKGLKDSFSGKLSGDVPSIDGELPSANADLKGSNVELPDFDGKLPSVDAGLKTPKLDTPSFDGSVNAPDIDGKLPSVNADLSGPNVDVPNVGGKLDRSISAPGIDGGIQSPKFDANVNMDGSSMSGSLGKLSAGLKGLKEDISGAFGSSADTPNMDGEVPNVDASMHTGVDLPHIDGKMPSLSADLDTPQFDKPSIGGNLTGSLDTPSLDGNLPALDADLKKPDVDLPHVSGKLDRSISVPGIDGDMQSPKFDASVDTDASGVSGSLGKLSPGFKGLKEDIAGASDGSIESPQVEGKMPAFNANLDGANADIPDVDGKLNGSFKAPDYEGKLPSLDANVKTPHADMPSVGARYDGSLNADLPTPKVDLPNVSGKFDRSIGALDMNTKAPSVEGGLKSPMMDADADVSTARPSLSGALGKLSSSFKGLKDDITGVFSGSADTPKVEGELPSVNTDYTSPKFGLPDADAGLDGSVDTPKLSGDLSSKDADLKSPHFELPGGHIGLNASIKTPDMEAKLPNINTGLDGSMTAPKADVDVPDLHSPNLDASVDGSASTGVPVAPPRKIGLSGSLGKIEAGLTTPKADVDVPQVDAHADVPVAPPRSPRLSLNKLSSQGHLDGSSNVDADVPEASTGFKGPTFNVHVNGKPALEGDLPTGLHRTASDNADISADKTDHEGSSSSFFSKPMEKISGAISSAMVGDGNDELSQDGDDTRNGNNNNNKKTASGYAHLRTRSRTESPEDLSAMLDDIVKRRFSDTPSESDVSSLRSDKKANKVKSATGKSRQMDAAPAGLNAGVSEPHASPNDERPRSFVSDSRFKELDEQEGDVTEYSTPLTSPVIPSASTAARPDNTAAVPTVTLDKMDDLESDVEKQLDAMSVSVGQAPQVPAHEDDQLPSPSKTHRSSNSLQSTTFQDRSAANAIKSVYDHMTSKLMTGGPKSGSGTEEDRVLKVRDGFENFHGFGVKCVSDNEDEEKHNTAPSSALK